ncbi:Phosphatidylinositol 3,4,5-trisphosphate-dependent Rac exchanger 2 protein [Yamadazyma tenuis]|nr:Phosphatidylinositol 3,4,5-trisphosphate-dependent Rac exchanger 2 protein [Yamadazyma tenuis]
MKPSKPLVWIDCEMTGLNINTDHIIEVCCLITDGDLNVVDDCYESTVYYDESVLQKMDAWCTKTHTESGLWNKVISNPDRTVSKVQDELLAFITKYVDIHKGLLAGNSVHMDKFFMMKEFPKVIDHLHYRLVDVSSLSEVGKRHNPKLMSVQPRKKKDHTAKSDILESIEQLRWLRETYLKSEEESRDTIDKLSRARSNSS